jgi:hypothetical protein
MSKSYVSGNVQRGTSSYAEGKELNAASQRVCGIPAPKDSYEKSDSNSGEKLVGNKV